MYEQSASIGELGVGINANRCRTFGSRHAARDVSDRVTSAGVSLGVLQWPANACSCASCTQSISYPVRGANLTSAACRPRPRTAASVTSAAIRCDVSHWVAQALRPIGRTPPLLATAAVLKSNEVGAAPGFDRGGHHTGFGRRPARRTRSLMRRADPAAPKYHSTP